VSRVLAATGLQSLGDVGAARGYYGYSAVCFKAIVANVRLFRKCHVLVTAIVCRVESGDRNPRVASGTSSSDRKPVCVVKNAARMAGITSSFGFRNQCEDVSGNQVSSIRASVESSEAGEMVTPYKASVFQNMCWQALNVLIPSQTFSACLIISSAGRTFHSFEDSTNNFRLTYST